MGLFGMFLVHCPSPYNVLAMYWLGTLSLAPSEYSPLPHLLCSLLNNRRTLPLYLPYFQLVNGCLVTFNPLFPPSSFGNSPPSPMIVCFMFQPIVFFSE